MIFKLHWNKIIFLGKKTWNHLINDYGSKTSLSTHTAMIGGDLSHIYNLRKSRFLGKQSVSSDHDKFTQKFTASTGRQRRPQQNAQNGPKLLNHARDRSHCTGEGSDRTPRKFHINASTPTRHRPTQERTANDTFCITSFTIADN